MSKNLENETTIPPEHIKKLMKTLEALEFHQDAVGEDVKHLLKNLIDAMDSDHRHIVRSVVFPEVYCQAGMALLHYFGRIIKIKYPGVVFKLSVIQKGQMVKLVIEVPESYRMPIEETLEHYGQVLRGVQPLTLLVTESRDLMEFKQKLDLSALELRVTKDLFENADVNQSQTIQKLEEDVRQLHILVGNGVCGLYHLNELLHLSLQRSHKETRESMLVLINKLSGTISEKDENEVKEALQVILRRDPKVFEEIHNIVTGKTISGKTGGFLSSWVASLAGLMPR